MKLQVLDKPETNTGATSLFRLLVGVGIGAALMYLLLQPRKTA